jgi:hypothetical protein
VPLESELFSVLSYPVPKEVFYLDLSHKLALPTQLLHRGLFSLSRLLIKICSVAVKLVSHLLEVNIIKKVN